MFGFNGLHPVSRPRRHAWLRSHALSALEIVGLLAATALLTSVAFAVVFIGLFERLTGGGR